MFRKFSRFAAGSAMLLLSFGVHAQWTAGANYTFVSTDDFDLGAVVGSIGYRVPVTDTFYVVPEVRAGFGVGDDTSIFEGARATAEIDKLWGFSSRFQYEAADSGFFIFGVVSYVNYELELEVPAFGFSESDDSWEFGYGFGGGYMITRFVGAEATYERVDSENVFTVGVRFNF